MKFKNDFIANDTLIFAKVMICLINKHFAIEFLGNIRVIVLRKEKYINITNILFQFVEENANWACLEECDEWFRDWVNDNESFLKTLVKRGESTNKLYSDFLHSKNEIVEGVYVHKSIATQILRELGMLQGSISLLTKQTYRTHTQVLRLMR